MGDDREQSSLRVFQGQKPTSPLIHVATTVLSPNDWQATVGESGEPWKAVAHRRSGQNRDTRTPAFGELFAQDGPVQGPLTASEGGRIDRGAPLGLHDYQAERALARRDGDLTFANAHEPRNATGIAWNLARLVHDESATGQGGPCARPIVHCPHVAHQLGRGKLPVNRPVRLGHEVAPRGQ